MNEMNEEQKRFIEALQKEMLSATNMTENEAYDFAFRVWQMKDFLYYFIERDFR